MEQGKELKAMATSCVTLFIDDELKHQLETLLDSMGLSMTTAFTLFGRAVVRQNKLPFDIIAENYDPNKIQAELERRIADMEADNSSTT
jgi:DNA-damage-inducible protein J